MSEERKTTAVERLQDAVGMIDDMHVAEAMGVPAEDAGGAEIVSFEEAKEKSAKRKKPMWGKVAAVAAGIAGVAIVGAVGNAVMTPSFNSVPDDEVGHYMKFTDDSAGAGSDKADSKIGWSADDMLGKTATDSGAMDAEASSAISEVNAIAPTGSAEDSASRTIDMRGSEIRTPSELSNGAEAFVLTAGVWNDNLNRPFFENLVNSGEIAFPSYGIDPRYRVHVTVSDESGQPARHRVVTLADDDNVVWRSVTDKDGNAYLFAPAAGKTYKVECEGASADASVASSDGQQGAGKLASDVEVSLAVASSGWAPAGVQAMFILDTTGSMTDELAYLQKDFASIAREASANAHVYYSANFYRDEGDEYVVKTNGFTDDVGAVEHQLMEERADGGGDTPEAVADVLAQTITDNPAWDDAYAHIAFLIFDAPPHKGTEEQLQAAVRSASERGIKLVPVVASNADRDTELFGRAVASCTNAPYVFLTDDSGVGDSHLEPIIGDYTVEKLHDVIVRLIREELA